MHVVFRVDASHQIGTGHVIRCLTLADALRQRQHNTRFICREHAGNLIDFIEHRGYKVDILQADRQQADSAMADNATSHGDWLGAPWQQDADETAALLNNASADWLVIDHYALDKSWHTSVRPYVKHIMVIDDLADRAFDADLLLDQNFYPDMLQRYDSLLATQATTLIGPQYALLRDEFIQAREQAVTRTAVNNILVFFGGVDQHGFTARALQALRVLQQSHTLDAAITVIAGNSNPQAAAIESFCNSMHNVSYYSNVNNMAELMAQADLAIGAGGTTTWERCYLGLPAIVVTLADNQHAVNVAVETAGACVLAGDTDTDSATLATLIGKLCNNSGQLSAHSNAAFNIMNHHVGVTGVVTTMEQLNG